MIIANEAEFHMSDCSVLGAEVGVMRFQGLPELYYKTLFNTGCRLSTKYDKHISEVKQANNLWNNLRKIVEFQNIQTHEPLPTVKKKLLTIYGGEEGIVSLF